MFDLRVSAAFVVSLSLHAGLGARLFSCSDQKPRDLFAHSEFSVDFLSGGERVALARKELPKGRTRSGFATIRSSRQKLPTAEIAEKPAMARLEPARGPALPLSVLDDDLGGHVQGVEAHETGAGLTVAYPRLSRLLREEGKTTVEVFGGRAKVVGSSGSPRLDQAALQAAENYFSKKPGVLGRERLAFIFRLNERINRQNE